MTTHQTHVQSTEQVPVVHQMEAEKHSSLPLPFLILGILLIFAGVATGYMLSSRSSSSTTSSSGSLSSSGGKKVFGAPDAKAFTDQAEGTLEKGGIDGEGTHKLIRPGGDSQTVYLTSSVVDLDQFAGKKVKVWGQTFSAKKAAWLMDVGRVEVNE